MTNKQFQELFLLSCCIHKKEATDNLVARENHIKLLMSFPSYYLDAAVNSVHDEYYLACFSKVKDSLSMWGHYAQGHRGICLVFEFNKKDGKHSLELDRLGKLPLYKVNYKQQPPTINVFESIGHLPHHSLGKHWLTYNGQTSRLAEMYGDGFHKKYWEIFSKRIAHKLPDWEYEAEHRVVHSAWFIGEQKAEERVNSYHLKHLKGVIFGYRTEIDLQTEIVHTLDEILDNEMKKSFKFYKARYSSLDKRLKIDELSFLKF